MLLEYTAREDNRIFDLMINCLYLDFSFAANIQKANLKFQN
jgi:hypothetical protein